MTAELCHKSSQEVSTIMAAQQRITDKAAQQQAASQRQL
jgi:hypothetical protein